MEENTNEEEKKWAISRSALGSELRKEGAIAAPMVAVAVLQYMLQVASLVMVGHLGELELSSVAIATSLTNVTGFSLLVSHHSLLPSAFAYSFPRPSAKKPVTRVKI